MSQILTAQPALEPVTLAEAKAHLRISHSDDDAYVSTLISAARRLVELRTGLKLVQQGWSVYRDRWPADATVELPLFPVIQVDDVRIFGEDDTPATLDAAHYFLDHASNPARLVIRSGRTPPVPGRRTNGIEIRLQAGFGANASMVPPELRQAVLLAVAACFARRGDDAGLTLPADALDLVAPYRTMRLA